ncbi:efflux RND transporter periplasmic adaptor subunit [Shewanella intestini]|uniref:Efflux RND transporter periplasmic adaptor subunit n=1 Tax=Shewanella intestini TaxID=2017544 RepID=A0ABS5I2Q3_9GAMM|nr:MULTISPECIES: efflux RND transporter periplasmic adaptor subunit [Shewanella]MBR9728307.1 efflux RND transporter periplasmic adaptor subunit [Shewanella intestini]MRG35772.1 efflux RND transporter periplasmic adaptor subunit [Shewanella sp. XMDDZSB0408]
MKPNKLFTLLFSIVGIILGYSAAHIDQSMNQQPSSNHAATDPSSSATINTTDTAQAKREILYWVAPMDPKYKRDKPGKSPMGMALVPVYADINTAPSAQVSTTQVKREILYWVAPMDPKYKRDKPGKSPMGMALVPVYADNDTASIQQHQGDVKIAARFQNAFALQTQIVKQGQLELQVNTFGNIDFNANLISRIHPRVAGWIENLQANAVGDNVTQGQVLFSLYSPDLLSAQQEFVSSLNLQQPTMITAAKQKLHLMGMAASQITQLAKTRQPQIKVKMLAAQTGVIAKLNIRNGMYIKPDTDLLTISGLDTVWVDAEVYSQQSALVKQQQNVTVTVDSLSNSTFTNQFPAKVSYVYPFLNPQTRTLKVRIEIPNPKHILKPGMFANIHIHAGKSATGIIVPRAALIKRVGAQHVILQTDPQHFQSVAVNVVAANNKQVVVSNGINSGDTLVTSGQFLIDSESNLDAGRLRTQGTTQ